MEEIYTIIEVADNLQYGIIPFIVGAAAVLKGGAAIYKGVKANQIKKKAEGAANEANDAARLATAELAARERRSFVPGFSDNQSIPGYDNDMLGPQPGSSSLRNLTAMDLSLGRPIPIGLGSQNIGGPRFENDPDFVDDVFEGRRGNPIEFDNAGNMIFNPDAYYGNREPKSGTKGKKPNFFNALPMREFNFFTQNLPKDGQGRVIAPDPNTDAGNKFYRKLPKAVADMISDPKFAQMYKGSNIVNPYANVSDLSRILENVSGLATDRTGLLSDRTDLIQDRTDLLQDRTGMFESAAGLAQDLSIGQEDLSERIVDLRRGAQDFSGLATDTSALASNTFANLQVATQAADLKAQQSDQALANTLSTIRATGAGAGGATAIAQAALQSKLGMQQL